MNIKNFMLSLSCIVTTLAFAQDKRSIVVGQVVEEKTKELIPYAEIKLSKQDSVYATVASDENGKFEVPSIPQGTYNLTIHFIGYYDTDQEVNLEKSYVDLGKITLKPESTSQTQQNNAVVVTGKRSSIINKIDRKVLKLGDDATTQGSNLNDVMNTVPGVLIDQNNAIQLRGSGNVRILINGQPTNMTYEQVKNQYPPSVIEQVEVITNPSAKYSPEGNSGIINFVLKKSKMKGTNIGLTTSMRYNDVLSNNNAVNANYNTGKVNFFVDASAGINRMKGNGTFASSQDNRLQLIDFQFDDYYKGGKIGADFFINDHNTLSVFTTQYRNDQEINIIDDFNKEATPPAIPIHTISETNTDTDHFWHEYNANYQHKFAKDGHQIELETSYSAADDMAPSLKYTNDILTGISDERYSLDTDDDTFSATLDYTNPLSDKMKLEAGLSSRIVKYSRTLSEELKSPLTFNLDRDVYAAYTEFSQEFKKFSYKVGLRAEYAKDDSNYNETGYDNYKQDYFELYPSAYLKYNLDKDGKLSLTANYSRRLDRPDASMLSPISPLKTDNVIFLGNPELKPQFTNSYELGIGKSFSKGYIGLTAFHRYLKDSFTQNSQYDPSTGITTMKNINEGDNKIYGVELIVSLRPLKWLSMNGGAEGYFSKVAGYYDDKNSYAEVDNNTFSLRLNNGIKLNNTLSASVFGMYHSKSKSLQSNQDPWSIVNLGLLKTFMDNQITLGFKANNIFATKWKWETVRPTSAISTGEWSNGGTSFEVEFKYNFRSGKTQNRDRKYHDDNTKKSGGGFGG